MLGARVVAVLKGRGMQPPELKQIVEFSSCAPAELAHLRSLIDGDGAGGSGRKGGDRPLLRAIGVRDCEDLP